VGLDEAEIFHAYNEVKSIRDKDEFLIPFINVLTDPEFKTGTVETIGVIESLIVFACLMEGLFSMSALRRSWRWVVKTR